MKTETEVRAMIASVERVLFECGTYQQHYIAAQVELIKALKWVIGEREL